MIDFPRNAGLALMAIGLAACGAARDLEPTGQPTGSQPVDVDTVSLEWGAGECAGYCQGTTDVGANLAGTYVERPWHDDAAYPPKTRSFLISAADWQRIRSLALTATAEPWKESYGCPDCADQGGWRLTVGMSSGASRTTALDNARALNPAPLEDLLEAVHALNPGTPLTAN